MPNGNTILYILTDGKSCHEQPRAARNYKELQRTAQKSHELTRSTGDANSKQEIQELPVATKSCQKQQRPAKWEQRKYQKILHTARMYQVLTVTLSAHSYYKAAKNVLKRPGKKTTRNNDRRSDRIWSNPNNIHFHKKRSTYSRLTT